MTLSIHSFFNRHFSRAFVGMMVILSLYGCGSSDPPSMTDSAVEPENNFSVPLPELLSKFDPNTLTAKVIIDGVRIVALTVNLPGKTVTGKVDGLSLGDHTFEIIYSIGGVEVYIAKSLPLRIEADKETSVAFTEDMFQYPDNDKDGWTNIAELRAETDPNKNTDHPPVEIPRLSQDYEMVDVVAFSLTEGIASSTDYQTVAGFALTAGFATSTAYETTPDL